MTEKNQACPKNADRRQDQKPIATKPMHARIIPLIRDFEISFSGLCAAVKSSGRTDLEINNFCLTRKFPSLTAPRTTKVPEPQDVDLSELIKTSLKARLQSRDAFSVLNILPVEINAVLMIETKSRQKWIALSALAHFGWHDSLGRCPRFATANPSCGGLVLNAAPLGLNRYPRP